MGEWQGQQVLGMRLTGTNATLRWHRLRPCLVWRLNSDPEKLLGGAEDLGITCALIRPPRRAWKLVVATSAERTVPERTDAR